MKEQIVSILVNYVIPTVAGLFTTVIIPVIIKKKAIKSLEKRINEVSEAEQIKQLRTEISELKKEIFMLRGKRK